MILLSKSLIINNILIIDSQSLKKKVVLRRSKTHNLDSDCAEKTVMVG